MERKIHSHQEAISVVIEVLHEFITPEAQKTLSAKSKLDDLELNSLSKFNFLIAAEEAFGVSLDDSDFDPYKLSTLDDVVSMLLSKGGS